MRAVLFFGTLLVSIDAQCATCFSAGGITFVNSAATWPIAREMCVSMGLDLLKITTFAENDLALSLMLAHNTQEGNVWIGLNDFQSEGTFLWADSTNPSYVNWNMGEPNNDGGSEDCGELKRDSPPGAWNDNRCDMMNAFLCSGSAPGPIGANGDPHLSLPHGGRADFRGEHKALYNFLSAKNLALNVMTEMADFELHDANHPRHKDIHGSFLTQAHIVARTGAGKTVRVSFLADKASPSNLGSANGTVDSEPAFFLQKMIKSEKQIDDLILRMDYSSLHVLTPEFEIVVTPLHFRKERNVTGLHHRLDLKIKPRVAEAELAVPPHGVIGQGWDGDGQAVDGEQDAWPASGEFTTYAMAKGAIEGSPNDYKVPTPYATDFKYSRFDATSAEPRNVAKLVAAGELNAPKTVSRADAVGSSEVTDDDM